MKTTYLKGFMTVLVVLWSFVVTGQVTTTVSNLKVNNVSATTINFNSTSATITGTVKMSTLNGGSNNILGNLYLFTKASTNATEFPQMVNAITFIRTDPPFVTETTYTSEIQFTITLQESHFYASGGILYAQYINNDGSKYTSSNISITGGTAQPTQGGGSSDLQLLNVKNEFYDIFQNKIYLDDSKYSVKVLFDYNHKFPSGGGVLGWYYIDIYDKNGTYVETLSWYKPNTLNNGQTLNITNRMFMLPTHFFSEGGSIQIRYSSFQGTWTSKAFPVQSVKFTSRNTISGPSEIIAGQTVNLTGISTRVVTGKVFDSRFNINRDVLTDVDKVRWYKRAINGEWQFIGEVLPIPYTLNETTEFLKRSFYKGAYIDSNILRVSVVPISELNTICCDQYYTYNVPLNPIIGNTPLLSFQSYGWQKYSRGAWTNIVGATSKDYTPQVSFSGRENSISFRRIVTLTSGEINYSNQITVYNGPAPGDKYVFLNNSQDGASEITIYPNPSSSIITILGIDDQDNISLFDMSGREISIRQNYNSQDSVSFDISNLPDGVYLVSLKINGNIETRKIIKN